LYSIMPEEICQYDDSQSRLRLLARLIVRHHLNVKNRSVERSVQEHGVDSDMKKEKDKHRYEDLPGDTGN
jgi:hypothetical protein